GAVAALCPAAAPALRPVAAAGDRGAELPQRALPAVLLSARDDHQHALHRGSGAGGDDCRTRAARPSYRARTTLVAGARLHGAERWRPRSRRGLAAPGAGLRDLPLTATMAFHIVITDHTNCATRAD